MVHISGRMCVLYSVVWCSVVWCGVVWCGAVWCSAVCCGAVWCGVVWCGSTMKSTYATDCFAELLGEVGQWDIW